MSAYSSLMSMENVEMETFREVDSKNFYMHALCKDGDAGTLRKFLNSGKTMNVTQVTANPLITPISYDDDLAVSKYNDVSIWDYLGNENDFDPVKLINHQDDEGNTPLHIACQHNHHECVRALLEQDTIQVNIKNKLGQTPLWIACWHESNESAHYLLQRQDVDINEGGFIEERYEVKDFEEFSPFYLSCARDNQVIVSQLFERSNLDYVKIQRDKIFFLWLVEFKAKKTLDWLLNNEFLKKYLHSIKNLTAKVYEVIVEDDLEKKEDFIRKVFLFFSTEQINSQVGFEENRNILMTCCLETQNLVPVLLEHPDIDVTVVDSNYCTAFDHAFFTNNAVLLKKLFAYCEHNQGVKTKLANIVNFRMMAQEYADYAKSKRNIAIFFSFLFNRFAHQGIKSLNIEVDDNCGICTDSLLENQEGEHSLVVKLSCTHVYCVSSISQWLEKKDTCPTCKAKVLGNAKAAKIIVGFPVALQEASHKTSSELGRRKREQEYGQDNVDDAKASKISQEHAYPSAQ